MPDIPDSMSTVHLTTSLMDVTGNTNVKELPVMMYTEKKKSTHKSRLINMMFTKHFNTCECFLLITGMLLLFALSSMTILSRRCITSVNTTSGESKVR